MYVSRISDAIFLLKRSWHRSILHQILTYTVSAAVKQHPRQTRSQLIPPARNKSDSRRCRRFTCCTTTSVKLSCKAMIISCSPVLSRKDSTSFCAWKNETVTEKITACVALDRAKSSQSLKTDYSGVPVGTIAWARGETGSKVEREREAAWTGRMIRALARNTCLSCAMKGGDDFPLLRNKVTLWNDCRVRTTCVHKKDHTSTIICVGRPVHAH